MPVVKCEKCGEEVSTNAAFCTACGRPMVRANAEAIADLATVDSTSPSHVGHSDGFNITTRQILGLSGSLILFFGVFTPIISLPIVGSVNYFQNGRGDGVFILLLAILSVFFTLTKRYRLLLFTGIGSFVILVFTFVTFQLRMSEMQSQMKQGMANNPFAGLGDAMFSTIQIQWGWAVLLIGAVIVTSTSLLKETPQGLTLDLQGVSQYFRLFNESRGISRGINIILILTICAVAGFLIYQLLTP